MENIENKHIEHAIGYSTSSKEKNYLIQKIYLIAL